MRRKTEMSKFELNTIRLVDLLSCLRRGMRPRIIVSSWKGETIWQGTVPEYGKNEEWEKFLENKDFEGKYVDQVDVYTENYGQDLYFEIKIDDEEED